ncbi:MAG TPA: bifunctional methylenetetrahydrofolate dehydrogenase/methenyltetrahydrofolate cyclohydrolase FolD [Burkholderiaceae bacterium]|nr:bifunctional methylenetetrahydrofolate dehydrogenase/methenyltetrahydrofolate cyclohydrolase FolD [Burkholderiaceae bacterium]
MAAELIDGTALARQIRADAAQRAARLTAAGHHPGLAVVLVGDSAASAVYVRNKIKACAEAGIRSVHEHLPGDTSEAALLSKIAELNADVAVDGILVQLPLPKQIDPQRVIEAIDPDKDVDGFHPVNAGALMIGKPRFRPCTPYGVMKMLEHAGARLDGAEAVVVGRSNIVGKPQALMLLQSGATVTICHSRTRDLGSHLRRADVVVAAVGQPRMITGDMIKPGAIVIDVGMNRIPSGPEAGKLCGDVDFASAREVAGRITPVPGGVGPMTVAMLIANTLEAAERRAARGT